MNNFNYNKLTPFKWFVLENFPFIEADFDALTEWQLFCKLGKEMNKIINSENVLGTEMENVTNAFIELQNYVNNYFNNLDVQEEVNNKLNAMAEDGTLQNIIAEFLKINSLITFNNVEDMKNSNNLINGSFAQTLGFYTVNDGGNALYKIRNITNSDIINNSSIIPLNNNDLIAELINPKNIKQFGAKGDNVQDDTPFFEIAINYFENGTTIEIPKGIYLLNNLNIKNKVISFSGCIGASDEIAKGSVFKALNNNTKFILRYEGEKDVYKPIGIYVKNIVFLGDGDLNNNSIANLIEIYYCSLVKIFNCGFGRTNGNALNLKTVMETVIENSFFRACGSEDKDVIYFDNYDEEPSNNCNNIHIQNNTFGYNSGNLIGSNLLPNIDVLWINGNKFEYDGTKVNSNTTEKSVINLYGLERSYIFNNTFYGFSEENNKYTSTISLGSTLFNQGTVTIKNNKFSECFGNWLNLFEENSPIVFAKDNDIYDKTGNNMTLINNTKNNQFIEFPFFHFGVSGIPNKQILTNFISVNKTGSSTNRKFINNVESLDYSKNSVISEINKTVEFFRIPLNEFYNLNVPFIEINLRLKVNTEGNANIRCIYNNILIKTLNVNSTNWNYYKCPIKVSDIENSTNIAFRLDNENSENIEVLFDGYYIDSNPTVLIDNTSIYYTKGARGQAIVYPNGKVKNFGKYEGSITTNTQFGSLYRSTGTNTNIIYPIPFKNVRDTSRIATSVGTYIVNFNGSSPVDNLGQVIVLSDSEGVKDVKFDWQVIGNY